MDTTRLEAQLTVTRKELADEMVENAKLRSENARLKDQISLLTDPRVAPLSSGTDSTVVWCEPTLIGPR